MTTDRQKEKAQKKSKLMQTKGQLMKSLNTAFSFAPPSILSLTICLW